MHLSEFEDNLPPRILYKYLSAERVENVLQSGTVRFSPLLNTNDTFEVRSTFEKVAGPKFLEMLNFQMQEVLKDESINNILKETLEKANIRWLPPQLALKMIEMQEGVKFKDAMQNEMKITVDNYLLPYLNDPETAWKLIEDAAEKLLCFSLSERMDSAPMWAHYAENNQGFIVAFNTQNDWFFHRKDGKNTRLQKVAYFDGKLEEPLENPQYALVSKTTDWAYEREWRLYAKENQVDIVVENANDTIHLIQFPPEAVDRIILGSRANNEIISKVRKIVSERYRHAGLFKAVPNRQAHTYDELPI